MSGYLIWDSSHLQAKKNPDHSGSFLSYRIRLRLLRISYWHNDHFNIVPTTNIDAMRAVSLPIESAGCLFFVAIQKPCSLRDKFQILRLECWVRLFYLVLVGYHPRNIRVLAVDYFKLVYRIVYKQSRHPAILCHRIVPMRDRGFGFLYRYGAPRI